jgi:type IV pilus biogenesis protein CpaD/CtpE
MALLLVAAPAVARDREVVPQLANPPAPGSAGMADCTKDRAVQRLPLPLGCAVRLNLEAMLAEPADLTEPAPLAAPEGEVATRAVQELRLGRSAVPPEAPSDAGPQGLSP